MLCIRFLSSLLSLSLLTAPLPLSAMLGTVEYNLSEVERDHVYRNQTTEYIYLDQSIRDIVLALANIDDQVNSPLCQLKKHLADGFVIGEIDAMLEIFEYADALLQKNHKQLDSDVAKSVAADLAVVIDQIMDGSLAINVSDNAMRNNREELSKGCSDFFNSNPICCPNINKINVHVRGKARFKENAFFNKNVTIKGKLKVFDNVRFKKNLVVDGDVSVTTDIVITGDLDLGNSTDFANGNILKNGQSFIQNFGVNNTFVGINAGNFTLTGSQDIGIGDGALDVLTTGSKDIAIGVDALGALTTGNNDIAIGSGALRSLTTGSDNIGIGPNAGAALTSAPRTINIGTNAGQALVASPDIINIGFDAGFLAVAATDAINIGSNAGAGLLSVLRATNIGTNAGRFVPAAVDVIHIGANAGASATAVSHTDVISIGSNAGAALTSASKVINIGSRAGQALTASPDIINIGSDAGAASLAAVSEIINIGNNAGTALIAGTLSINIGHNAGASATSGDGNTAVGQFAMNANISGSFNTALGTSALEFVTGDHNIGIGDTGGVNATTGDFDIYIGNPGVAGESSTIRIGAAGGQTRAFMAGINGVTTVFAAVPVLVDANDQLGTISSSARFKHDIQDMGDKSADILNLRPVTFVYNEDASETQQYGLIAEDVDQVFPAIVVYDKDGNPYTVQYHVLPVLLLNEMQKQQVVINALQNKCDHFDTFEQRIQSLESAVYAAQ